MAQRLRLRASSAGGVGSIAGRGTKIPHAIRCGKKKKVGRCQKQMRSEEAMDQILQSLTGDTEDSGSILNVIGTFWRCLKK